LMALHGYTYRLPKPAPNNGLECPMPYATIPDVRDHNANNAEL